MFFIRNIVISFLVFMTMCCASKIDYTKMPGDTGTVIDKLIVTKMREGKRPGLSALVMSGDEILWDGYYGYADIENEIPVTEETSFFVSSVSKLITATAIMQLVEKGKIDLDGDINSYIDFSVRNPGYPDTPITMRMLLRHDSSIRMNWFKLWFTKEKGPSTYDLGDFSKEYLTPGGKLYSSGSYTSEKPGESFKYSNPAFALMGHIIENVSGLTLEKYSRRFILDPLGMKNSAWSWDYFKENSVAERYGTGITGFKRLDNYDFPFYPAMSFKTTPKDMGQFMRTMAKGGEHNGFRILSEDSVKLMTEEQKHIKPRNWDRMALTWQFRDLPEGYTLIGHTGGLNGMGALAFYCIENDKTVMILMNGEWQSGSSYDRFKDKYIREIFMHLLEMPVN